MTDIAKWKAESLATVLTIVDGEIKPKLNWQLERNKGDSVEMKPSIGRVVHYMKYGTPGGEHKAEPSAAIITKVLNEETKECQLFVMNPNGLYFNPTPYSDELKPGCWSWPARV